MDRWPPPPTPQTVGVCDFYILYLASLCKVYTYCYINSVLEACMYHTWLSIVTILHAKGNKLCEKSWDLKEGKKLEFLHFEQKKESLIQLCILYYSLRLHYLYNLCMFTTVTFKSKELFMFKQFLHISHPLLL